MNKNLYLLYKISKQIKNQYSLYSKYGFNNNIKSLSNKSIKQQSFIVSKKSHQGLIETNKTTNTANNKVKTEFTSKYNSFLSTSALNGTESTKVSSNLPNYTIYKEDLVTFSDTEFGISNYSNQRASSNFFELENSTEKNSHTQSFKIPKDFTIDFRNIED